MQIVVLVVIIYC